MGHSPSKEPIGSLAGRKRISEEACLQREVGELGAPRPRPQHDREFHAPVEGTLAALRAPVRVRFLNEKKTKQQQRNV